MTLGLYSIAKGSQDRDADSRDLKPVTETDAMEGCWLLAPSYSTQDHLPRAGLQNELGPPSLITNQENAPQLAQANLIEVFSPPGFCLPK